MGERGVVGQYDGSSGNNTSLGWTNIDVGVPAQCRGVLQTLDIYVWSGSGNVYLKIFRDDGTNYVYVDGVSITGLSIGPHLAVSLSTSLDIEEGDLIGYYSSGIQLRAKSIGSYDLRAKVGNITTTTPKSGWGSYTYNMCLRGHIFKRGGIIL